MRYLLARIVLASFLLSSACSSPPTRSKPKPVSDLVLERTANEITLRWRNPSERGLEGVLVVRYLEEPNGVPQPGARYRVGERLGDGNVVFLEDAETYVGHTNGCGSFSYQTWVLLRDGSWSEPVVIDVDLSEDDAAPAAPATIGGPTVLCGASQAEYSVNEVVGAERYEWHLPGGARIISDDKNATTITVEFDGKSGPLGVAASNSCSTSSVTTIDVAVNAPPLYQRGQEIAGPSRECANARDLSFSVSPFEGAESYVWTLPSGSSLLGSGDDNIVALDLGDTGGELSVVAQNQCGQSPAITLGIELTDATPSLPGEIVGAETACAGAGVFTYSIPTVQDASSYTWTVPAGATILSGASGPSMRVRFGTTPGPVSVTANNGCGSSPAATLDVSLETGAPAAPASIGGPSGVCVGSPSVLYTASSTLATSYIWSVTDGASLIGEQGTETAEISFDSKGIPVEVNVRAKNTCGRSPMTTLTVVPAGDLPPTPSDIVGSGSVCASSARSFSVPPVGGVDGYSWRIPSDAFIVSGQGSPAIDVLFGAESGTVSVSTVVACGSGAAATLPITTNSAIPSALEEIIGPITSCDERTADVFSVEPGADVTSYAWTVPLDATITSLPNGPSITVDWGNTSGVVAVTPVNGCGAGPSQNIVVDQWVNTPPAVVTQPISGSLDNPYLFEVTPAVGTREYRTEIRIGTGNWATASSGMSPSATVFVGEVGLYQLRTQVFLEGCPTPGAALSDPFSAIGPWGVRKTSVTGARLRGLAVDNESPRGVAIVGDVGAEATIFVSPDTLQWNPSQGAPAVTYNAIDYGAGQYIAVGEGGTVAVSTDSGATWATEMSGTGNTLHDVVYRSEAPGRWIAVGASGEIRINAGSGWSDASPGITEELFTVEYLGSNKVLAAGAAGTILWSDDNGDSWSPSGDAGTAETLQGLAKSGVLHVAVGDGGVIRTSQSPGNSAVPWSTESSGTSSSLHDVTFIGALGLFIAVGDDATLLTSVDGTNWTPRSAPTSGDFWSVEYDGINSRAIVVGDSGTVLTSVDGVIWSRSIDGSTIRGFASSTTTVVAVGANGLVLTSTGGDLWTRINTGIITDLNDVSFVDPEFIAVGDAGTLLLSADDGVTWLPIASPTSQHLNNLAHDGARIVAVGDGGVALTALASAPTVWSIAGDTTSLANFTGVEYGSGVFVAVGLDAGVESKSVFWNGIDSTWTAGTGISDFSELEDILFDGTAFVAVGRGTSGAANAYVSMDGSSWSAETIVSSATRFTQITVANGLLIAAGEEIATSGDGSNWTMLSPLPGNPFVSALEFARGRLFLGTQGQEIYSSP